MHFTCPEEHFYKNNMLTLWNSFRLWARKCRSGGRNFAALLTKLLFCHQMSNWKKNFEGNFAFSDFFWTSREHFLVFSVYHSRHGDPNWIPPAKRNIFNRKKLKGKFLSPPDYERSFLNIHWSLLGMLSKLQFTCSKEHFEKGYFFRILQNCFWTLSANRPDLWRNVSSALPKLHSTYPKNWFFCKSLSCCI